MRNRLIETFSMHYEKEEYQTVIHNIDRGVVFKGANLWILIFAIFVASLGLNVNSTAVIIGAMLISPLMGPIMGIGLSMGINDIGLLKKTIYNFLIASGVALVTSTVFFLVSPLNDAHSEILARTEPSIYDVLIALFGGTAGIIATSSRQKGNVIPGVAIATALMPPLCTAGYGLATLQFGFFFGSFYLFIINTVFIALATLVVVRLLKFPYKQMQDNRTRIMTQRITGIVVLITLLPSIYFGYDMVMQNRFEKKANSFISEEAHFNNDYLLNKKINPKTKSIVLVFGGKKITENEIDSLKAKLAKYNLTDVTLDIKQGFAYLTENTSKNEQIRRLAEMLAETEKEQQKLQTESDSLAGIKEMSASVYRELKIQYPGIRTAILEPSVIHSNDSTHTDSFLVIISMSSNLPQKEQKKMQDWLKVRLNRNDLTLIVKK